MKLEIYKAHPVVEKPLLDNMDKETIVAWFRCNSCLTCRFREKVVDEHPTLTIKGCARMHERCNIVYMVELLGYSKE